MAAAAVDPAGVSKKALKKRLTQLLKRNNANKVCADCPEKRPTWGSIIKPHADAPLGSESIVALVCFQCAGIHRRLGTHICFVRSVSLDDWSPVEVKAAEASGNVVVNGIYEATLQKAIQQHSKNDSADGPAVNIKPLAGAHMATRERYIRSKYVDLYYYHKPAHYDYLSRLQQQQQQQYAKQQQSTSSSQSSTMQSPLKKLGMFLSNDKASILTRVGSKSVNSSTYGSSGDDKSFASAPVLSTVSSKSSSVNSSGSESQSVCVQLSATKQLKKGRRPLDLNGSNVGKMNSYDDSTQSLKFDGATGRAGGKGRPRSFSNGSGSYNNSFNTSSSNSVDMNGSQEKLPTGSGHNHFLEKQAPHHKDPRRTAFHNSKNGFDVSPEELADDSDHNQKPKSASRPHLVSATPTRNSNSNSRINLYSHGARERSSSRSRRRNASLEKGKRHRSSSRGTRDKKESSAGGKSGTRGRRGRSRSANKDHDIITAGVTQKTRERSESRTRARSSSRQRGSGPSVPNLRHSRGQSRSRQAKSVEPNSRMNQSSSQLLQLFNDDPLKATDDLRRDGAVECKVTMIPGEKQNAHGRSKSCDLSSAVDEDLSGMILIFDESSKSLEMDSPKRQHRSASRTRSRNKSGQHVHESHRGRKSRSRSRDHRKHRSSNISQKRGSSKSLGSDGVSISPVRKKLAHPKSGSPSPSRRGRRSSRNVARNDGENHSPVKREERSQSRGRSSLGLAAQEMKRPSSSQRVGSLDKDGKEDIDKAPLSSRSIQHAKSHSPSRRRIQPEEKKASPRSMRIKSKSSSPTSSPNKRFSPRKSGEGDFQVISSKRYSIGGTGSHHSADSSDGSFAKPYKSSKAAFSAATVKGSEGIIKDRRRCSRTIMAARTAQRQSRKSDIFASLDREETEQSKPSGPLFRNLPQRSKSGGDDSLMAIAAVAAGSTTKNKLLLRPSAPPRSKSMDLTIGGVTAAAPDLDLGAMELGRGHNNDALLKAWETRVSDTSHQLQVFDETTRVGVL